eukprot:1138019-Pelagomonas_calceolata.AAC.2
MAKGLRHGRGDVSDAQPALGASPCIEWLFCGLHFFDSHYFLSNRTNFLCRNVNCRGGQGGLVTSEAASSMFVSVVGYGARLW